VKEGQPGKELGMVFEIKKSFAPVKMEFAPGTAVVVSVTALGCCSFQVDAGGLGGNGNMG
jgi:hypothetical protein